MKMQFIYCAALALSLSFDVIAAGTAGSHAAAAATVFRVAPPAVVPNVSQLQQKIKAFEDDNFEVRQAAYDIVKGWIADGKISDDLAWHLYVATKHKDPEVRHRAGLLLNDYDKTTKTPDEHWALAKRIAQSDGLKISQLNELRDEIKKLPPGDRRGVYRATIAMLLNPKGHVPTIEVGHAGIMTLLNDRQFGAGRRFKDELREELKKPQPEPNVLADKIAKLLTPAAP